MFGDTPVSTVVPATTPVKTTSSFLDKFNNISNSVLNTASGVANTIGLFKNNGTAQPYTSNPVPQKKSSLKWWLIGGGVAALTTVVLVVRNKKKKKSLAGTPRKSKKSKSKKS